METVVFSVIVRVTYICYLEKSMKDYIDHPESLNCSGTNEAKYPVIVWIHGESYDWNSGNPYDGRVLAGYADVVVVTINYRLGILGFLNANVAPHVNARVANYGLMDQVAALDWVRQNIGLFGGDPTSVTLVGHGTGAACINFLMISPAVVSGLFNRTVLLSGSALSSWALVEDPVIFAVRLAQQVNCSIPENLYTDHEQIVDCLRDVPLEELMRADVSPPAFLSAFGPSVDGVVIRTNFQSEIMTNFLPELQGYSAGSVAMGNLGHLKKTTEFIGYSRYSAIFGVSTSESLNKFSNVDVQKGFDGDRRDKILRTYVRNAYTYHLSEIFFTVVNEYTDWERTVDHPMNTRDATIAALSDAQYVAPLVQIADLHSTPSAKISSNVKSFFFVFDYQTKDSEYPQRMGSVHGEELPYLFGAPLVESFSHFSHNYTKAEVTLSETFIVYLTNFARTGNPNEFPAQQDSSASTLKDKVRYHRNISWEGYDPVHQKYLEFSLKPRMKNHFRAHQLSVWLRLIPELHRAGMEDVVARHNLFRNHNDGELYDGVVRADPLSRPGPAGGGSGPEPNRHLSGSSSVGGGGPSNGTVAEILSAPTTVTPETALTTCMSLPVSVHSAANATVERELPGYTVNSTAFWITVGIGCTLLVLNLLIFASIYYQRDRSKMESHKQHNSSIIGISGGPAGPPEHSKNWSTEPNNYTRVDVESSLYQQGYVYQPGRQFGFNTLPTKAQLAKQLMPNDLTSTLPCPSQIHHSASSTFLHNPGAPGPPNGSVAMHLPVPKPPQAPRSKSPPETTPLIQQPTPILKVPTAAMSEMRV
nr:PREDICTED: neuroligin-1-like [Bemisia tabaci]